MRNFKAPPQLQEMISLFYAGQLGQALLIHAGDDESHITAELVRVMLCEEQGLDACRCRSCLVAVDSHPDYSECGPTPRTISKEAVRRAVAGLAVAPVWSPVKVIVLRPAETLGREAETYLLKHLEEPPPYVYYLLVTHSPEAIIPTIRSRCQSWRFAGTPTESENSDMLEVLKTEPLTTARLVQAAYWVRQQYRQTQLGTWLGAWETLQDVYRQLEANGNEELARAQIFRAWPHS